MGHGLDLNSSRDTANIIKNRMTKGERVEFVIRSENCDKSVTEKS